MLLLLCERLVSLCLYLGLTGFLYGGFTHVSQQSEGCQKYRSITVGTEVEEGKEGGKG